MCPGPPLYVAGDNLAGNGEAHLRESAYTEASDPMRSLEFRVRRLDARTDPVPLPPLCCLVECIHLIPQAKLRRHLQAEVPGGVTGRTSFRPVVGCPHGTAVEHIACAADIAVEDGMEGTALRVVAAEDTVIYGGVAHGTADHTALIVEDEEGPACHIITEPAAVDGGDELDPLLPDLQCGENGGIARCNRGDQQQARIRRGTFSSLTIAAIRSGMTT